MTKCKVMFAVLLMTASLGWSSTADESDAYSGHNGIYIVAGYGDFVEVQDWSWLDGENQPPLVETLKARQLFKLGFSFKYQLFHQFRSGVYLAYTQSSFWNLMGESSPFLETNYNPEVFWRFENRNNFAGNLDTGLLNHIQAGIDHLSNGVAGPDSRGMDRLYGEISLGYGDLLRADITARYFSYFYQFLTKDLYRPDTPDIHLYRSNMLFSLRLSTPGEGVFFLPRDLLIRGGPGGGFNGFDWAAGFVSLHLTFGSLLGGVSPYAEMFWGTGESLVNYDTQGLSLRFGLKTF